MFLYRGTTALLLLSLASVAGFQFSKPKPVDGEPHHQLLINNSQVRVFTVELAPGAATELHQHDYDFVRVITQPTTIQVSTEGRTPQSARLSAGELQVTLGKRAERVRNIGQEPARYLVVEFLNGLRPQQAICGFRAEACSGEIGGSITKGSYSISTFFETPTVKAYKTSVDRGVTVDEHEHKFPHLAVALGDLHLRNSIKGKDESEIQQKSGDAVWIEAGITHSLANLSDKKAEFISIEVR